MTARDERVSWTKLFFLFLVSDDDGEGSMNISTKSGNTVPDVNPAELYDTITGCVSQDPATLSQYQKRLEDLLKLNGAYDALHDIGASRNIQHSVRHQALIQFKNAALNHWRSRKYVPVPVSLPISLILAHQSPFRRAQSEN